MIDSDLIDLLLTEICHIPKRAVEQDDLKQLAELEGHLKQNVFGQEEAMEQISNAVKFSREIPVSQTKNVDILDM